MNFFKSIIENRKLIFQLGKNDFRNKFANTSLGAIWGFISPFVFMLTYVIVFQYILKTGSAGNYPFVVWYIPGMAMWMFLNDSITNCSNSIRNYSYLVKKVVFPVDVIPIISMVSTAVVSIFLFLIAIIVCIAFGFLPNILMLIYFILAAICFLIAVTRFTSAVTTLVPDFSQLLIVVMQLMFWLTPIIWNLSMIGEGILGKIVRCSPFTYLVTGFREVFIDGNIVTSGHYVYTIVFWVVTVFMFIWGNYIFNKNKKDFADV
ncbi:MAG: ABC transporter permease, partial [Clostridia bacterium]